MYTAIVLSPVSANLLKWIVRATVGEAELDRMGLRFHTDAGEPLPHHMTINLGAFDTALNPEPMLGVKALMTVRSFSYDEEMGVCAAPVVLAKATRCCNHQSDLIGIDDWTIKSANKVPHITIALRVSVKPRLSNKLLETETPYGIECELDQDYLLEGVVAEVQ